MPLPGVCVCVCVYEQLAPIPPGTRVHACPAMIITARRSHSKCVCAACVRVYIRVFVRVWAFVKGDYTLMFEDDQNVIHVKVMRHYTVCLLRTYRVVFQGDVSIQARLLAHTHTHTHPISLFSQTHAHKPGRTPGQGLQSKGMSKGKRALVKEQRGVEKRELNGSKMK